MTARRQKLREFWIKLGTRRLTEKEFLSETVHDCISPVPIDNSYHVKEVSPDYDKAVDMVVDALRGCHGCWESTERPHPVDQALAAYENVSGK